MLDKKLSELEETLSEMEDRFDKLDEDLEYTNSLLIDLMNFVGVPDPTQESKSPVAKSDN